ncbi:CAMK protein kinase [Thecamonas trahens ATCC 50062]|uniref:CAMK protein kinase n=1 Tax=Thecamonas trahens ATCC 50062 TaxID=461836 RepID=A0A0L0DJ33_THETB|nr:CAMK protein kinase [Thecamonas trahens ATCC 50062]KNC52205.1 CAMK protein kinase [Thecamonas trahens ATCC 50062]|eukprot:XP_013762208.1 CAMK protein kinase [Thecamonas trahens ATCC 50062]
MAASLLVHGMESDELSASSFAFSSSDGDLPPAGDGVVVVPHEDGASKEGAGTSQSEISSDALLERLRKAEAALASRDALILSLEDDIDALIESHRRNQEEKYDALAEADEHIKALQGQIALLSDELTRSGAPQRRRRRKRMSRSADVSLETADADLARLQADKDALVADRTALQERLAIMTDKHAALQAYVDSRRSRRRRRRHRSKTEVADAHAAAASAPAPTAAASAVAPAVKVQGESDSDSDSDSGSSSSSLSSSSSDSSSDSSAADSSPGSDKILPSMPALKRMPGFTTQQEDNMLSLADRYIFRKRLFTGNDTVVFRASPMSDPDAHVVVKIFNDNRYSASTPPKVVHLLSSLPEPRSPYIIPMLAWHPLRETGTFAVVYPYIEDASAKALYNFLGRLSLKALASFAYDILLALQYFHKLGFMYRDIKPDNILFDAVSNRAILIDFDTVIRYDPIAPPKTFTGSQGYMAPEVADEWARCSRGYTPQVDVYSLGVLMFELVFNVPLDHRGRMKRKYLVAKMSHVKPSKRKEIHDLLDRMLTEDPNVRITVDEALQHPFFAKTRASRRSQGELGPVAPHRELIESNEALLADDGAAGPCKVQ